MKRTKLTLLILTVIAGAVVLCVAFSRKSQAPPPIVEPLSLLGKSEDEVRQLLGEPDAENVSADRPLLGTKADKVWQWNHLHQGTVTGIRLHIDPAEHRVTSVYILKEGGQTFQKVEAR